MSARSDWTRHLAALRAGRTPLLPVVALVSSSPYLLDEALAALRHRALGDGVGATDLACDSLSAKNSGAVRAALTALQTRPLFAAQKDALRLVHLSDLHRLPAKEHPPLLAYLAQPAPATLLCLTGEKCDMRSKLGKALSRAQALFALALPRPSELPPWVKQRAQAQGAEITPGAAALLAELVGADLGLLVASLTKLQLYAGDAVPIAEEHVSAVVCRTRHQSIFDLTAAVGRRTFAEASVLAQRILHDGESALVVLTMLMRHIRQLMVVCAASSRTSSSDLAAQLSVAPFVIDTLREQARNFSYGELRAGLQAAAQADSLLKGSGLPATLIVDNLIAALVAPAASA